MRTRADHFTTVQQRLHESVDVKQHTIEQCIESIVTAAELIADKFRGGGKLLLCGNGASALDCQHVAAQFVTRLTTAFERPALPAIVLTAESASLGRVSKRRGVQGMLERQVKALGKAGDLLLVIDSGNEDLDIAGAIKVAKKVNLRTIALTGSHGDLAVLAHIAISVPSLERQRIREAHVAIENVLCELVESMVLHKVDGLLCSDVIIGTAHDYR